MNEIYDGNRRRAEAYLTQKVDPSAQYSDLLDFPRYFEIETVNTCNARCTMCTIQDWERPVVRMSDALFEKIARELAEHREVIKSVSLFRDCEPLIDKKLPQKVALLKSLGVPHVGICTNGSLLTEERGAALLEAGIDKVQFSIDSLRKDVYEKIRVRLELETVLRNTENFIRLRDRINPATSIRVRMIDMPENRDEQDAYRAFWAPQLGPQDVCDVRTYHNWGGQLDGYHGEERLANDIPCLWHWASFAVFSSGEVPLCGIDFNNRYPTGNLNDNTIQEIWTSPLMRQRRMMHLIGLRGDHAMCKTCNVWDDRAVWDQATRSAGL